MVVFSKIARYGAVPNREEIRRNAQAKTPRKNPTGPGAYQILIRFGWLSLCLRKRTLR